VRRGDAASCSYATPGTRKKSQTQSSTSPDDMQNRIDRLEGLVLSLMTNGAQSVGPAAANAAISRSQSDSVGSSVPPRPSPYDDDMIKEDDEEDESEVEGVTNSLGVMKVDETQGKAMYIGESHWHLVLADVSILCLKSLRRFFLRVSIKHIYKLITTIFCNPFWHSSCKYLETILESIDKCRNALESSTRDKCYRRQKLTDF